MAAARKPAVDPLKEELPPVPEEPKPESAADLFFDVEISPYVVGGQHYYRWTILDHNAKAYAGDYVGHTEAQYLSSEQAEQQAAEYVNRVRAAVELKLNMPDSYRITL